jgi:hypothetical protein
MYVILIYCLVHILKDYVDTGSILTVFLSKAAVVAALCLKPLSVRNVRVCFTPTF